MLAHGLGSKLEITGREIHRAVAQVGSTGAVLLAILCSPNRSEADDKAVILSEFAYYDKLILKVRPSYTVKKELKNIPKLEVLLGKPFSLAGMKFIAYLDVKSDLERTVGLGPRIAAVYRIKRTFIGFEGAYFFGLNDESEDLFKGIPYIMHKVMDRWHIGLLNIGDYYRGRHTNSLGPFVSYSPSRMFNVFLRYGNDFEGGNRVDLKFNFRFGRGRKETRAP